MLNKNVTDHKWFDIECHEHGCQSLLLKEARAEITRLKQWVADLQSGQYVNCVYCGHKYGSYVDTPVAMADLLKTHVEHCPEHPMSKLRDELDTVRGQLVMLLNDLNEATLTKETK